MKITTLQLSFQNPCTFQDAYAAIFSPNTNIEISPIIKFFRRFRTHIIGLQAENDKTFKVLFSFPRREILTKFREEFSELSKEIPE